MNLLSQSEVEDIARGYYPKLATAIHEAFNQYIQFRVDQSKMGIIDFKPRTSASLIHDLLKRKIKELIGIDPDTIIGEFNGIYGVLIQGKIFIRFKKFNKDLITSNVLTSQTENYNNQIDFAGFGEKPTLLTAGYIPDATWTQIKNIYLVCRTGDEIIWRKDLTSDVSQGDMFSIEETHEETNKGRVSIKEEARKTGTDNK